LIIIDILYYWPMMSMHVLTTSWVLKFFGLYYKNILIII
jgi:hypothetical protein